MTDDDKELIARLRAVVPTVYDAHDAADRIEALTEQLAAAHQDADEAEAYAWELEQELGTCRKAQAAPDPACDHCGTDPAAIREAALRDALKAIDGLPEYGSPDVNIGVSNAYSAILALIGEKPHEQQE